MLFSNPIRLWAWVLVATCVAGLIAVLALIPVAEAQTAGSSVSGKKIVLDPGHGGSDSGATQKTANGTLLEKEQNLIVANKLKGLLEGSGATVYMTRTTDKALSNTQRYEYANTTGADILVSLHMNGSSDPKVDYTNVLYGKWFKDRDLSNAVFKQLSTLPAANGTGTIATRAPYQYSSGVLFKSNMPAIMAESVFITNTDEGKLLLPNSTGGRQDQIAQKIKAGVENYFSSKSTPTA